MPRRKNDRDGDGWSDSTERARGSNPHLRSSRPTNDSRLHRRRKADNDRRRREARRKRRMKSSTMGTSSSVDGNMLGSTMPSRSLAIIIVPIAIFSVIAIAIIIFFLNFSNLLGSLP
ncbi:MAG: hypothetical protein MUP85_15640 [Candidatus Lokiarchaeota archaeon]|nr:hypothetical protein [Candidatus Lokiarchaeota archaeon]